MVEAEDLKPKVQEAAKKVLKLEKARAEAPTAASKKTLGKKVEQAKK